MGWGSLSGRKICRSAGQQRLILSACVQWENCETKGAELVTRRAQCCVVLAVSLPRSRQHYGAQRMSPELLKPWGALRLCSEENVPRLQSF
jgi:hypothetical protein